MNATNYYVSTCRLVLQAEPDTPSTWQDLYNTLPILRNSLSCTVCEGLLTEPYTPEETTCEHHVCKGCKGGTKKLRPTCSWCRDYSKYFENVQLRILLENYKKLCKFIKITKMFEHFGKNKEFGQRMKEIISESEGEVIKIQEENVKVETVKKEVVEKEVVVKVEDDKTEEILEEVVHECEVVPLEISHSDEPPDEIISSPLSSGKPMMSISPSQIIIPSFSLKNSGLEREPDSDPEGTKAITVVDNSAVIKTEPETSIPTKCDKTPTLSTVSPKTTPPRSGGKIKREAFILDPFKTKADTLQFKKINHDTVKSDENCVRGSPESSPESGPFKQYHIKPHIKNKIKRKSGCRCGNATPFPGKLTCCGQRCPCYVDSLACMDCKCKGCRNPHRPGGGKVRPHLPHIRNMQVVYPHSKEQKEFVKKINSTAVHLPVNVCDVDSHPVNIGSLDLASIPVLNLDSLPSGDQADAVLENIATVPISLSTSNVSFSGLSSMSHLSSMSQLSSISQLSTGPATTSVRLQPVSVISVVSGANLLSGDPTLSTQTSVRTQGRLRTSSDGLQLIEEVEMLEESEEENSDIDIDVGI